MTRGQGRRKGSRNKISLDGHFCVVSTFKSCKCIAILKMKEKTQVENKQTKECNHTPSWQQINTENKYISWGFRML